MSNEGNLRGIGLMALATFVFVINDTFLKMVTADLPAFQSLFLRGLSALVSGVPMVVLTGNWKNLRYLLDGWVTLRNLCELAAVLCFIVALKNMPIADITALGQLSPMFLLIFTALFFREKIGVTRYVLVFAALVGALLVAQPTGAAASPFAILGFFLAVGTAFRDLVSRRVPREVPGPIVAFSALIVVTLGSGTAHLLAEDWVVPSVQHIMLLLVSGFFLTIGHVCIFLAYRHGTTAAVAPFFYMFTVWAVISGVVVFGTVPNGLALIGIAFILGSGVLNVLLDERARRLRPVA